VVIEVAKDGETAAQIALVRGGRLRISVTESVLPMRAIDVVCDRSGDPSANVWLVQEAGATGTTSSFVPTTPMDIRSGHPLAPGDYAVNWMEPPNKIHRVPFRILAGEETRVTLR
jgi:hypothetical protein